MLTRGVRRYEGRRQWSPTGYALSLREDLNVLTDVERPCDFAECIIRHAHRTSDGAFPHGRVEMSTNSLLKYQGNVRHCVVNMLHNADSVEVAVAAVQPTRSYGTVSYTMLGPVEDHPFADEMCRVLVIRDASLKLASREAAEAEANQHYAVAVLERRSVVPTWTNAAKRKRELETLLAPRPGFRKPSADEIKKAREAFSDAAVAADANYVKALRRKLADAGYVSYGNDSVARILQENEHVDTVRTRDEEKKSVLEGGMVLKNCTMGKECLAEALSSFRSYRSESGDWHPAMTPWAPPRDLPTFTPTCSKGLHILYKEGVRIKMNAHSLCPPCDPRGPDACVSNSNPSDLQSSDSGAVNRYERIHSSRQAVVSLPLRKCLAGDRESITEAQERLCVLLLAGDDRLLKQQLNTVQLFLSNRHQARMLLRDYTIAQEEALRFTASRGSPILTFFETDVDAVTTLASYLHAPKDIVAMIRAHPAFNVEALRRRLPHLLFDSLTAGWSPQCNANSNPSGVVISYLIDRRRYGAAVFRTGTMFDVGAVFAKEGPFRRVNGRVFFGESTPMLRAVLRFDTPSADPVPDVATGPPLQIGVANTDRESGSMRFVGAVTNKSDVRFCLNRVRVLAGSHEYRGCFKHEMEEELAKAEAELFPGHRRIQEARAMISRNSKTQHFFIELQFRATSVSGHNVSFTTRTPPFAVAKHINDQPRPARPSRSKRKLSQSQEG